MFGLTFNARHGDPGRTLATDILDRDASGDASQVTGEIGAKGEKLTKHEGFFRFFDSIYGVFRVN